VATKGEWVGLFRNERDADPYVVAQATTLFIQEISPNPAVFTIPHKVQVFAWGFNTSHFNLGLTEKVNTLSSQAIFVRFVYARHFKAKVIHQSHNTMARWGSSHLTPWHGLGKMGQSF